MIPKSGHPVACFAPPLSDSRLARCRELVAVVGADQAELRDALKICLQCVEGWWELPESTRKDTQTVLSSRAGKPFEFTIVPLEEEHQKQLWDVTPWMRELETLSNSQATGLFDSLPPGELRDAAFHLLWFCKELTLDREPLTADKLPS